MRPYVWIPPEIQGLISKTYLFHFLQKQLAAWSNPSDSDAGCFCFGSHMARMRLFLGLWLVLLGCSLLPPVEPSTEELLVGTWVNERPERMPGWESPDIPFLLRETLSLREDDGWSSTKQWTLWGEVKGTDLENGTYQVDADTLLRLVQASTTDVLPGTLLEDLVVSVDRTTLTLRCLSPIEDSILEYERQDGKRE